MKLSTGIEGLDKMLKGGLVPYKLYLIKGGPGTGKTTLSTHFTIEGVRNGEKVMYITLGESKEEIKEEM
ncbi:ATPase, partial [Archaeoglobales archaeon]